MCEKQATIIIKIDTEIDSKISWKSWLEEGYYWMLSLNWLLVKSRKKHRWMFISSHLCERSDFLFLQDTVKRLFFSSHFVAVHAESVAPCPSQITAHAE